MARVPKEKKTVDDLGGDFTAELISSLNKENGSRIAYNLAEDESVTPLSIIIFLPNADLLSTVFVRGERFLEPCLKPSLVATTSTIGFLFLT